MRKFYQTANSIAGELRIGNYVHLDDMCASNFYVLDEVPKQEDLIYKWIEPIELNEEWLLKFGFKDNRLGLFDAVKVSDDIGYHIYFIERHLIEVQYVHKLQNLYFELIGEELNGNQPKTRINE